MRHHWPILRTALAALAPLVLITWIHWDAVAAVTLSLTSIAWLLAGALYTQLVEYWSHRVPMHRGLPHLTHVRWNHLDHHRIFHGTTFQTRDVNDLAHIAGRFWVFPILFLVHYAALVFVIEAQALIVFMLGTVLHYLLFEATHWLTHIEDNPIDRMLARIPLVSELRGYQIEHHRIHHEVPEMAFNFNPPYLGDRIAGHMPNRAEAWARRSHLRNTRGSAGANRGATTATTARPHRRGPTRRLASASRSSVPSSLPTASSLRARLPSKPPNAPAAFAMDNAWGSPNGIATSCGQNHGVQGHGSRAP